MILGFNCDICKNDFSIDTKDKSTPQDCPYCNGREEMPVKETPPEIHCPKCNSTQITANKKGFGLGKAAVGAAVTGGVGLLAGFIGSGKVKITCLSCGFEFEPGK